MPTKPSTPNPKRYYYGLGRRKESSAQARLFNGKGDFKVNELAATQYFGHDSLVEKLRQPLALVGKDQAFDITIKVAGGGKSGQADASRLAIAKALVEMDKELRTTLKKAGYLKRDSRVKERKKYGLKRARKAPQFTKR